MQLQVPTLIKSNNEVSQPGSLFTKTYQQEAWYTTEMFTANSS